MKDSTTATEEFQSGRLGPSDRYPTPRRHDSSRMRSGTGQLEGDPPEGSSQSKKEVELDRPWLLGAERPPPAMEFTLPSFVRAEMTGPRKARTDVWDTIKQHRDQLQGRRADFDPWLNKVAQGGSTSNTEKPVAELERHNDQRETRRDASTAGPTSEHHGNGDQEVRGNETRNAVEVETIREQREANLRDPRSK